eukprot:scaffold926_cov75-Skeletonema_dohrnii-CCMP3373.AAC.1
MAFAENSTGRFFWSSVWRGQAGVFLKSLSSPLSPGGRGGTILFELAVTGVLFYRNGLRALSVGFVRSVGFMP